MSKINYNRHRSLVKGYNGVSNTPLYHSALSKASDRQIAYVKAVINQLESVGVDTSSVFKGELPYTVNGINAALHSLHGLMKLNGIKKIVPSFVNICRSKETGKKIQYTTSKRYHAPIGYEFLYELRTEFKCVMADNS